MKTRILPFLLLAGLLAACGEEKTADKPSAKPPAASVPAPQADLPANAPAVGTSIEALVKPSDAELAKLNAEYADYTEIEWENLELPGQGLADIVKKYQPQIDAIPEGDPAEDAVLEKMQSELNAAPVNPAMNGKKVKIPGFISPLEVDDAKGVVKEFLLVPYFGACIHVPPPPLNQTLLVKPVEGKSIGMERMYEPVWVYGTLAAEQIHTDLAEAGYQMRDARVEIYQDEEPASQSK
jgi:hypothetical protein